MPEPEIYNERELLVQLAEGNELAFKRLYERYSALVFSFVQVYIKDESVTDDLVQLVFIRCWESRSKLKELRSLKDFLFITARNMVYDHLRRMAVQVRRVEDFRVQHWYHQSSIFTTSALDEKELRTLHKKAITRLPAQQQEVYIRYIEQEQTLDEISEAMLLARSTVKKHLEHARRSVRGYINQHLHPAVALPVLIAMGHSFSC